MSTIMFNVNVHCYRGINEYLTFVCLNSTFEKYQMYFSEPLVEHNYIRYLQVCNEKLKSEGKEKKINFVFYCSSFIINNLNGCATQLFLRVLYLQSLIIYGYFIVSTLIIYFGNRKWSLFWHCKYICRYKFYVSHFRFDYIANNLEIYILLE